MKCLLSISAIVILFVYFQTIHSREIYVSMNGIDSPGCGARMVPCASLSYIFDDDESDLNDSIVYVQEGQYDVSDIYIQSNNLTLMANGTVYLKIHKYAFQIYSNNFTLDGFHFSYSTTSYISYFLLNLESYAKQRANSNFVIKNCVFENINYYGLVSAEFHAENNGTLHFLNNRIYNTRSDFVMEVDNMNIVIDNLHLENYTTEGIAFKIDQQNQTFQASNMKINKANSYDLYYIEYASGGGAVHFTNISIEHSNQRNNLLYLYSRVNINRLAIDNMYINNSTNVYFINEAQNIQNCSLHNINIEHSSNPTSNVRLDAVFELPAGNYSVKNITFSHNSAIFSVFDFQSQSFSSNYAINNVEIANNAFDTNIYYYNLEHPTGGIIHLSLADSATVSNLTAINNTGIIQIIGVTEANTLLITNNHFENNKLTNGLAHDVVIIGNPTSQSIGQATIQDNHFSDPYPNIACYDSVSGNFVLTLQRNQFGYSNSSDIYANALNTNVNGMCRVNCDSEEIMCGAQTGSRFWIWILVAFVCVIVIFAIGLFVAWKLREQKRNEYEPLE